jgi:hypothetical protein
MIFAGRNTFITISCHHPEAAPSGVTHCFFVVVAAASLSCFFSCFPSGYQLSKGRQDHLRESLYWDLLQHQGDCTRGYVFQLLTKWVEKTAYVCSQESEGWRWGMGWGGGGGGWQGYQHQSQQSPHANAPIVAQFLSLIVAVQYASQGLCLHQSLVFCQANRASASPLAWVKMDTGSSRILQDLSWQKILLKLFAGTMPLGARLYFNVWPPQCVHRVFKAAGAGMKAVCWLLVLSLQERG